MSRDVVLKDRTSAFGLTWDQALMLEISDKLGISRADECHYIVKTTHESGSDVTTKLILCGPDWLTNQIGVYYINTPYDLRVIEKVAQIKVDDMPMYSGESYRRKNGVDDRYEVPVRPFLVVFMAQEEEGKKKRIHSMHPYIGRWPKQDEAPPPPPPQEEAHPQPAPKDSLPLPNTRTVSGAEVRGAGFDGTAEEQSLMSKLVARAMKGDPKFYLGYERVAKAITALGGLNTSVAEDDWVGALVAFASTYVDTYLESGNAATAQGAAYAAGVALLVGEDDDVPY